MPIFVIVHQFIITLVRVILFLFLAVANLTVFASPANGSALDAGGLVWKNVFVDGRKMTVYTTFCDSRGLMWLGCNGGLYCYDGFNTYPVHAPEFMQSQVYAIVEHDGTLYVGTNNLLAEYDLLTGNVRKIDGGIPQEIRTMLLVGDRLWIGSLLGAFSYDLVSRKISPAIPGLPHKSVYSLLRDSRGIIYAGTYNGLARYNDATGCFCPVDICDDRTNSNLFVNSMSENTVDGTIWLGTGHGLKKYRPINDSVESDSRFSGHVVKSLATDKSGRLAVGTENGLYILNGNDLSRNRHDSRNMFSISDNEIWSVSIDSAGNICSGNSMGLSMAATDNVINSVRVDLLTDSGEGSQIYSVLRDSHGLLWLGGTNGIMRVDGMPGLQARKVMWYRPDAPNTISHKRIRSVMEDGEGSLYVATDGGINRFDRSSSKFTDYRISDRNGQFNANWVYKVVDDGEYIIAGSYLGGIHVIPKNRFDIEGHDITVDSVMNSSNGLANDFVNDIQRDSRGNKWLLLFRDSVVTRIDANTGCHDHIDVHELTGEYPSAMTVDAHDNLWCGFSGGVISFTPDGKMKSIVRFAGDDADEDILAMSAVGNAIWVSTVSNVWRVSPDSDNAEILPLPQKDYTAIYEDRLTGDVILGSTDEVITVDADKLSRIHSDKTIRMVSVDGRRIFLDGGETGIHIPSMSTVNLNVSTLDYSPESTNRFAYKIIKDEKDTIGVWTLLPEGVNQISLSNLSIGRHIVAIKVLGSSVPPAMFGVEVDPPLYLSWWAIVLYVLMLIFIAGWIVYYIRRRNKNRMLAAERRRAVADAERRLTFLADISHDLKTPLSMIIGPLSVVRERPLDNDTRKKLDVVYEHAMKLNALIHRTVELNHLDSDADSMLIISKVEAVEFCSGIMDSYRETHPEKTFVFQALIPGLYIDVDVVKLESVINNLLSNACKYSGSNATISCSVGCNGSNVEIIVSDDGVGIPADEQSLIFQRMFRSPRTAKGYEGTGIGLYLIKKFLELHGGSIELYSRENEGTTFIVSLPISKSSIEDLDRRVTEGKDTAADNRTKILVVEDNDSIASFIQSVLDEEYNVIVAANGRSGLAVASSFQPDLIIVDEMMPIMSGLEMCRRLKENPRLALIPVIMLTAKTDNRTEAESVKCGIDVFMSKPFEADILLGRIRHLIESKHTMMHAARIEAMTTPKPVEIESVAERQLAEITRIIEENMSDSDLNVNTLAEKSGIGTKQLYRLIKKLVGVTPVDYIRRMRIRKAAILLEQHKFTVSEITYMVGFKTPSYFSKCFINEFGCKPSQYTGEKDY